MCQKQPFASKGCFKAHIISNYNENDFRTKAIILNNKILIKQNLRSFSVLIKNKQIQFYYPITRFFKFIIRRSFLHCIS